jgi:hypothetical protein
VCRRSITVAAEVSLVSFAHQALIAWCRGDVRCMARCVIARREWRAVRRLVYIRVVVHEVRYGVGSQVQVCVGLKYQQSQP